MKKYIFMIFIITLLIYNYIQISIPVVKNVNISTTKIEGIIKITQISDLHNNKHLKKDNLIKKIKRHDPDIIVLTGDIIDRDTRDWSFTLNFLKEIQDICRDIYFISGNHDIGNNNYYSFMDDLKSIDVNILDNKIVKLETKHNQFMLGGLSYDFSMINYGNLSDSMENDSYNILLSHSPDRIISTLSGNEDLVLSGHTHGGQVRLPFIGAILAPGQGLLPKYDKGIYYLNDTILYIDSGLGNSILPVRFLNPIQISNISIHENY